MKNSTYIRIKDAITETQFEWLGFDGDDCFSDFHIDLISETDNRRFDFGPCAVHGVRKLSKFFQDDTQSSVSLGFRHPDIRCCDVHRADDGYRLLVRFEGSGLSEQFHIHASSVQIDDGFLKEY
jgi:hypothetical protein